MNQITKQDQDAVLDRLSWQDDDIIFECKGFFGEEGFLVRRDCQMLGSRNYQGQLFQGTNAIRARSLIAAQRLKVLRPFLTTDGVLFKPEAK